MIENFTRKGGRAVSNTIPIPAAAAAAGMERLVFADEFDSEATVDSNNERIPGFLWYIDRAYGRPPMTPEELEWHTDESFLRIKASSAMGITSYSSTGDCGFSLCGGYVEGRVRFGQPTDPKANHPLLYMIGKTDFLGKSWADNGLLCVMQAPRTMDKNGERRPYYVGSLHHYQRSWERDKQGKPIIRRASNLVNSTGYRDWFTFVDEEWHTYGMLWEKGHIAWYMDGREMHAVRFGENELPRHYYRNNPHPVPTLEEKNLQFAKNTWLGAYTVFDSLESVLSLCGSKGWPMDVDWVRVWQK